MSSGGDPKMPVTEYYASVMYGVCHGADEVLEVYYGEKRLWSGNVTTSASIYVNRGDMFGGEKVEGGFRGYLDFHLGESSQTVSPALAASLERNGASNTTDPNLLPGFRGILSFFIHG